MKLRFLLILPWVLALLLSCRVALADDSFPLSAADYFDTDEVTDAIRRRGRKCWTIWGSLVGRRRVFSR